MSNLIKSVYFNVDASRSRVIDSDEKVEEYIPNIYEKQNDTQDGFTRLDVSSLPDGLAEEKESFDEGIPVISMESITEREREKLSQQLDEDRENILEEARTKADQILQEAQEQVDAIRANAVEEGRRQGMAEGLENAKEQAEQLRQQLETEYAERFQELEKQEKELEPEFAKLVVSLVRKLTGVVCEDKKGVILYLLGNAMKNLGKAKQVTVRVSKEDMPLVASKKATFKAILRGVSEFDIEEDNSLTANQCIIETENKIIDCSLDAQLKNLEEHIKLLAY